jgi:dipeptidyl aminopeptidase/acylaminoacyl peptidase
MKTSLRWCSSLAAIGTVFFLAACLANRPAPTPGQKTYPWPPPTVPTQSYYRRTATFLTPPPPTATYTKYPSYTQTPSPTVTPRPTQTPSPTVTPTQPKVDAGDVQANAVVFIAKDVDFEKPSSLWIANIDGSGERELTADIDEPSWIPYGHSLQWSPDGKWISYKDMYSLWIISRDGLVKKKLLTLTDQSKGVIFTYQWSPDSSQIAYLQTDENAGTAEFPAIVGLIHVATGQISELTTYESSVFVTLSWTPDGRYLLLNPRDQWGSINLFEVRTGTIVKISPKPHGMCTPNYHDGLAWSPNGMWFYYTNHGNGRFATNWICVAGLDGSNRLVPDEGSAYAPVWDKTGNYLYFAMLHIYPNFEVDDGGYFQLMRYNVRTHETEPILLLDAQPVQTGWWNLSLSKDRYMLEVDADDYYPWDISHAFIILDVRSPGKYTVYKINKMQFISGSAWAPDNQNIIFFAREIPKKGNESTLHAPGAFYALDINTGLTRILSGTYLVDEWAVSPIAVAP